MILPFPVMFEDKKRIRWCPNFLCRTSSTKPPFFVSSVFLNIYHKTFSKLCSDTILESELESF
uniref:Uncharacterized protein n=1 Tax=Physcomitrium patens TaxID=3218 RepID=A0A2K1I9L3_PHYPA|nr:hypothetical protein PHYPA_031262 [Physcomitrium patens]